MLRFAIPVIFVLIWSTGFIVGKAVAPHADLQLYLVARFSLTALECWGYPDGRAGYRVCGRDSVGVLRSHWSAYCSRDQPTPGSTAQD
jgi:hypothetical protein